MYNRLIILKLYFYIITFLLHIKTIKNILVGIFSMNKQIIFAVLFSYDICDPIYQYYHDFTKSGRIKCKLIDSPFIFDEHFCLLEKLRTSIV
jgi:hypothetical protein